MDRTGLFVSIVATAVLSAGAVLAQAPAPAKSDAERGFQVFMSVGCYECHGTVGQGGGVAGPRLAPEPPTADRLLAIVRKPLKEMPPYNQRILSDADVVSIHAYLASIKPPPPLASLTQLRPEAK